MPTIADIIDVIEQAAPLRLQEDYDNSGLQLGDAAQECSGVLLCLDITPGVVSEAAARGCNLVVSHHPLFFKGVKHLVGATLQERAAVEAIRAGVALYSGHTNVDSAPGGVNAELASRLGLTDVKPLEPSLLLPDAGMGAIGRFPEPLAPEALVERVKGVCGSPVVRCSALPASPISRMALCGGSGGSLIDLAVKRKAQAILTSDVRYHDFVDYAGRIFIIDIGHYESEHHTKEIFHRLISEKFPNFAVNYSETERNPINYL